MSQIGQWSGVPLHLFLRRVGADLRARYVAFTCFRRLFDQYRHGKRAACPNHVGA